MKLRLGYSFICAVKHPVCTECHVRPVEPFPAGDKKIPLINDSAKCIKLLNHERRAFAMPSNRVVKVVDTKFFTYHGKALRLIFIAKVYDGFEPGLKKHRPFPPLVFCRHRTPPDTAIYLGDVGNVAMYDSFDIHDFCFVLLYPIESTLMQNLS